MEPWREELRHHGIIGQKWGVRRFQNRDGTRTEAGKKRYSEMTNAELKKAIERSQLENRYYQLTNETKNSSYNKNMNTLGKAARVISNSGQILNKTGNVSGNRKVELSGNVINQSGNLGSTVGKQSNVFKSNKKIDLSKMSDSELKKMVNRLDLESQYSKINENTKKTGREYVDTILDYAGAATAIGASALGIAVAIKTLKG